jgi:hypothetical protein
MIPAHVGSWRNPHKSSGRMPWGELAWVLVREICSHRTPSSYPFPVIQLLVASF